MSSRARARIAPRPIFVWKRNASPNAMSEGSSRCPKLSKVFESPIAPG